MNTKRTIWIMVSATAVIAGIAFFLVWIYWSSSSQPRKVPAGQWLACQTDQDCVCVGEKDFPGCVNGTCVNGKCGWRSDTLDKTSTTTVQNTAANWQTYRNEQYGFEVRYPSGWQVSDDGLGKTLPSLFIGNSLDGLNDYTVDITV